MLNSDLPIEKMEDDVLNRTSFVESLAKVMLEYTIPEGFTIGLYGKWGSGKTSVINMLLETVKSLSLTSQQNVVTLKFNPWMCSDSKQLISQFFKQLSTAIKMKKPRLDKIYGFINDYADAFEIAGAIPKAGSIFAAMGKILGKKANAYLDSRSGDLQKIKDEIRDSLQKEKIKIIVTIDDIDRLSNEEIISVFQLVKSLADFPYTIYLLSFDRDVVIRALKDVQQGDGAKYLEKIIQVPFELPSPNAEDIYQIFYNRLDSIVTISENNWDKEYWGEMFHFGIKPYLKSIRDVVRYANTFALKYALLKDETYLIDLIALTCLQVFEPEIYIRLQLQKEHLCGGENYYDYSNRQTEVDKIQNAFNFIVAGASDDRTEYIKNILTRMFPKLKSLSKSAFGLGFEYSRHYNEYIALNNGYISCAECFDRYFSLTLESTAIPQHVINNLLFNADETELSKGVIDINAARKTTRLLDHIHATFESGKDIMGCEDRAELILKILLLNWHKLDDDQEASYLSMPFDWRLLFIVDRLLKTIKVLKRLDIIKSLFKNTDVDISTMLIVLRNFQRQHNRLTDKKNEQQEPLITFDELLKLEKIVVDRIIGEIESQSLFDNASALYAIWFLEKLDEEKTKKYALHMVDSNLNLAKFISASVGHGKGAGRTIFKIWNVNIDSIKKYIDINIAYERISEFVLSNEFRTLSADKKENIAAFLIEMEKSSDYSMIGGILFADIEKKIKEIEGDI